MTDQPSRRELMKPLQLLGLALGAAVFAGVVTLVAMGFFQQRSPDEELRALIVALIVLGSTFIVVLVVLALLLLVVDPAQVTKSVDRPVLLSEGEQNPDAAPGSSGSSGRNGDTD